jgi:hypothetical protein
LFSEPNSNGVAFLNLDGGLSEGTSVSVGLARIPFLVSIDLNGDGLNDIVAVGWLPSTTGLPQDGVIAPFLTDDAGGFSQGPTSSIATAAIQASLDAVATGDFDGNGKLGLLVLVAPDVSPGPANELVLYPQDGDGGFAAPTSIASLRAPGPGFYQPMAVGDINGDGKADVVVLDTPGSFTVLLSGGSGQFTTSTFDVPGASPGYGSLVVGDFDGDGHLDLAFSNPDVTVSVVLGDGQGNFGPAKISEGAMLSGTTYPSMLVADDLNGDGHPDVAVLAPVSPPFLRLLIGKGDGTFEPPADFMFSDPSMNLNPLISIPQPSDPGSGRADLSLSYVRYVAGKSAAGGFMLLENGCN